MNKALIITSKLVQDHEFIYPFYRVLEEGFELDVCLLEGKPVKGILGTTLPPNKDHPVKNIEQISISDYDLLILPGNVILPLTHLRLHFGYFFYPLGVKIVIYHVIYDF